MANMGKLQTKIAQSDIKEWKAESWLLPHELNLGFDFSRSI